MKPFLAVVALLVVVPAIGQQSGAAQTTNTLVGTWRLISATGKTERGQIIEEPYGHNPTGFLMYTADGRMMVIITNGGRKPFSISDRISAPANERAEAFATLVAYGGRYTITGDKVIHHLEISAVPNFLNTDNVRTIVKVEGKRLTLRTTPLFKGGQRTVEDLVWERM